MRMLIALLSASSWLSPRWGSWSTTHTAVRPRPPGCSTTMAPADQPRDQCRCAPGSSWCLLVAVAVAACGTGVPRPVPVPVPVLSNYERNGTTIRRDCGYSSPLPGKPGWSLWLFCDTVIASARGGKTERLILGTDTAAAGPYRAGYPPRG